MSAPFSTLYLDPRAWDLTLDAGGNIAMAMPPYALAQDAASACRTFLGEVYYDATQGVPYLQEILGKTPALNVLQAAIVSAAVSVPFIKSAICIISGFKNRQVLGQVLLTDEDGDELAVGLGGTAANVGIVDYGPNAPARTYLTDSSGNVITDSSGNPIWTSGG